MLYQIYLYLIKIRGIPKERVLFISIDDLQDLKYDLRSCIEIYKSEILFENSITSKESVFFLLDEINHNQNWSLTLKIIYDKYPNAFIVATGSSALELEEEAIKDLAGRVKKEYLFPLNFIEYLKITGKMNKYPETSRFRNEILNLLNYNISIPEFIRKFSTDNKIKETYEKIRLYSHEIDDFLKFGGFPFTALRKESSEKFLLDMIEKIANSDIPKIANIRPPSINDINNIIRFLARSQKTITKNISKELNIDINIVKNILEYLKKSFLIFSINPYGNEVKIIKEPPKYYFITPTIRFIIKHNLGTFKESDIGFLFEEYVASTLYKIQNIYDYYELRNKPRIWVFYDSHENSADFLIKTNNNKIIPIEVKYGKGKNAEEQVRNSMERYKAEYGIIIGDYELEFRDNILYIPKELFLIL